MLFQPFSLLLFLALFIDLCVSWLHYARLASSDKRKRQHDGRGKERGKENRDLVLLIFSQWWMGETASSDESNVFCLWAATQWNACQKENCSQLWLVIFIMLSDSSSMNHWQWLHNVPIQWKKEKKHTPPRFHTCTYRWEKKVTPLSTHSVSQQKREPNSD